MAEISFSNHSLSGIQHEVLFFVLESTAVVSHIALTDTTLMESIIDYAVEKVTCHVKRAVLS
jgi:catabolite regulation protein CreA